MTLISDTYMLSNLLYKYVMLYFSVAGYRDSVSLLARAQV